MLRWHANQKLYNSAKIVFEGKQKITFKRNELENLKKEIENLQDEVKRLEGKMLLEYIMHGRKILLEEKGKKIHLFGSISYGRVEATWSIEENPELYSLLKNLF